MFFDSRQKNSVLLLDIGNGSVGAAVALISKGNLPKIICSLRELITFDEKPHADKLQAIILEKLDHIIPLVLKKARATDHTQNQTQKVETVLCVLSSPWFYSRGKTLILSQDKKFLITHNFLQDILAKEQREFENEMKSSDSDSNKNICELVEKTIIGAKLSGYVLDDPMGKSTNHLELSLYMSLAEEKFVTAVSKVISKYVHVHEKNLLFHSFPLVTFSSARAMFPSVSNYVHFDVAGEITDVMWVAKGIIQKTLSFPSGKNLIVRQIAKQCDVPETVARSYFHMYMERRTEPKLDETITEALAEAEKEWNIYVEDALSSLSPELLLPEKVILTAYPQTADIFSRFLKVETAGVSGMWRKNAVITYLGEKELAPLCTHDPREPFDAFLSLEAYFLSIYTYTK